MIRTLSKLVVLAAVNLASGCRTEYIVSVSPRARAEASASVIHVRLSAFLASAGFSPALLPSENDRPTLAAPAGAAEPLVWIGHWRRVDPHKSFWYGQAQLEVCEYHYPDKTLIYIDQYNGPAGLDQELSADIEKELDRVSPDYSVIFGIHVIDGPSWSKN